MENLEKIHCVGCEGGIPALNPEEVQHYLKQIHPTWRASADHKKIYNDFRFKNYYQTIAFVNAIAWMTHFENHHPDLEVGYNHCLVSYTTHAIGGLSKNDFICAAKVDLIFQPYQDKYAEKN